MRNDITLDKTNDLMITNGDFYISDSDYKNCELILRSVQGQWKQYVLVGANIRGDVNGLLNNSMRSRISKQLADDGYTNVKFNFIPGTNILNIKIN